ncbi:Late embryogenesis abundant (LEA) hydroxyproline-rich glycoprotein family [Forsythia ovata]|uniref:Late embryogenesis abundant (LEA) hydroxyproline-rich glycoprotein family n=1 Tax=Forsythia ovata TaxID=205694 RepID=A0ABD1WZE2_9LAMI
MTDRVYPSAKQAANGGEATTNPVANGGANPTFPANKAQLYNATRPMYRPQPPPRRRHNRSCCCSCCLWTTLLILLILLLTAIAGAVFWVLYRPHRPSFTVSSLQLSKFNLTDTAISSTFNITLTARNPNKKIAFFYDPISVKVFSGDLTIGEGSLPGFIHGNKNVTTLRSVISSSNKFSDGTDTSPLKSSLKNKNLPLKIQLDTKVKVKVGKVKTKKLRIRVTCDGIKISVPTGKAATAAKTTGVKCKLDPRIKIIKWTV